MRAFKRDVLRIRSFVCNEIAREHTRHTKEDGAKHSPLALGPFGDSDGSIANQHKKCPKITPLGDTISMGGT